MAPLKNHRGLDTLILGCTHYPIIADQIQTEMGDQVQIISSGEETAREVSTILSYQQIGYKGDRLPEHVFYTTGEPDLFAQIANQWMDDPVRSVENVSIDQSQNK